MPHDHGHGHAPAQASNRVYALAVGLNVGFVLIEVGAGLWTGSLALLADAAHNLTDAAGLAIAWGAAAAARIGPRGAFSYGFGRGTIIAAAMNGLAILIGVGAVLHAAVGRAVDPPEIDAATVGLVALAGIAVNAGTAALFVASARSDLNARGAFLHMAADAAVSVAVVVSAVVMAWTGAWWIDPAIAVLVSLLIAKMAWDLLRAAGRLMLDAPPEGTDVEAVRGRLAGLPGVRQVHDLHVWSLSTSRTALTAHLVMPGGHPGDGFLDSTARMLGDEFGIGHTTLQIETGDGPGCALEPREREDIRSEA